MSCYWKPESVFMMKAIQVDFARRMSNMQDDGHIFCLPEQTAGEIRGVLDLVEEVMGAFGFKEYEVFYRFRACLRKANATCYARCDCL